MNNEDKDVHIWGGYTYIVRNQSPDAGRLILLLHRTGDAPSSLFSFAERLVGNAQMFGLEGPILEGGKPRFFRRVQKGVFDEEDLWMQAARFARFVAQMRAAHPESRITVIGHSNGANLLWAYLLREHVCVDDAILLRPMMAFDPRPLQEIGRPVRVLILAGEKDPVVPGERYELARAVFAQSHHQTAFQYVNGTHDLSDVDLLTASTWLKGP